MAKVGRIKLGSQGLEVSAQGLGCCACLPTMDLQSQNQIWSLSSTMHWLRRHLPRHLRHLRSLHQRNLLGKVKNFLFIFSASKHIYPLQFQTCNNGFCNVGCSHFWVCEIEMSAGADRWSERESRACYQIRHQLRRRQERDSWRSSICESCLRVQLEAAWNWLHRSLLPASNWYPGPNWSDGTYLLGFNFSLFHFCS